MLLMLLRLVAAKIAAAAAPVPSTPLGDAYFTPKGRYGHCTFVVGGKMYALGGAPFNVSRLSDKLMVFDPPSGKWALLNDATTGGAPPGIEGHACTAHPHRPWAYITGGNFHNSATGLSNKTYVLDLTSPREPKWTAGPQLPAPVRRHTAIMAGSRLVLYGGSHGPSCQENLTGTVVVATSSSDGASISQWKQQPTSGSSPAPRMGHVSVLQPSSDLMYVVAGQTCNSCADCYQNDAHVLDLQAWRWSKVSTTGTAPRARYGPSGWWNHGASGVQITGGTCGEACGACGHANDTFLLQFSAVKSQRAAVPSGTWMRTNATGLGPPPRDRHCTVPLSATTVLDFGGYVDSHTVPPTWPTDVYQLDLATAKWTDASAKLKTTDEARPVQIAAGRASAATTPLLPPPPFFKAMSARPGDNGTIVIGHALAAPLNITGLEGSFFTRTSDGRYHFLSGEKTRDLLLVLQFEVYFCSI